MSFGVILNNFTCKLVILFFPLFFIFCLAVLSDRVIRVSNKKIINKGVKDVNHERPFFIEVIVRKYLASGLGKSLCYFDILDVTFRYSEDKNQ